jgi:molybdopterin converting factor subunit 1
MKITVQFFAAMADAARARERELELPDGATVADAWAALKAGNERLGRFERSMLCAVNAEYATMEDTLREGDRAAFFPPVGGG